MNAPQRVLKYCEYLEKTWTHHKITKRISDLNTSFRNEGPTDENVLNLNRLDNQMSEIMNAAEKRCTKMNPRHQDSWSVKLDTASKGVFDLKYQLKKLKKVICGSVEHLENQISDVDKALIVAKENYKQTKKEHKKTETNT